MFALRLEDTPRFVFLLGFMMVVSPCFLDPLKKARIPVINLSVAYRFLTASCVQVTYLSI